MFGNWVPLVIIICIGMVYSISAKKLTIAGASVGAILAILIFIASGYAGLAMMTAFFCLGSAATSWNRSLKQNFSSDEENKHGRSATQVLANAGIAGIMAVGIIIFPHQRALLITAIAAAFASATADTLSSELGVIYGKRFFNILNFKTDLKGLDGVVSIEGTFFGVLGSSVIASIYALSYGWNSIFLMIVLSGTAGNLTDSILGALFERKGIIKNDMVNFLNTLAAVTLLFLLSLIL